MSNFKDLGWERTHSDKYLQYWEENYSYIKDLLLDIDKNVYNGWGEIWGNREGEIYSSPYLLEPKIGMFFYSYSIGLSPSMKHNRIRVIADQDFQIPRQIEISVDELMPALRSIITWFIDNGLHETSSISSRYLFVKKSTKLSPRSLIGIVDGKEINFLNLPVGTAINAHKNRDYRKYRNWYPDAQDIVVYFYDLINDGFEFTSRQLSKIMNTRYLSWFHGTNLESIIDKLSFRNRDTGEIINLKVLEKGTKFKAYTYDGRYFLDLDWDPTDNNNIAKWIKVLDFRCKLTF